MPDPNELELRFKAKVFENLEKCGVDRTHVNIRYEDYLQDFDITINGPAEALSDEQYAAIAETVSTCGYIITFNDEAARNRLSHAQQKQGVDQARRWLAERGKLEGLPAFDATRTDLVTYARALEAHLGFVPGSTLEVRDIATLGRQQIAIRYFGDADQYSMAVYAITASNLRESGVITGYIGGT